jgi:hypothetical protein
MIIAVIIAIVLTLAYNAVLITKNKGIPPSLSDSFYVFGGQPKGYIFYGYLIAMLLLLVIPMKEVTPEKWKWMPFIALSAICFVGAAADFFAIKQTKIVHTVAAYITALLCLTWCVIVGCWDVALWSMVIAGLFAYIGFKNRIYWLEMGCFAAVFITLLFRLLT